MGEECRDKGKCISCAFLALVPDERFEQMGSSEMPMGLRKSGKVYTLIIAGTGGKRLVEPVCVRDRANFRDEVGEPSEIRKAEHKNDAHSYYTAANQAFARDDRNCDAWSEYAAGVSPNMALEFTMFERLEENRQKWVRQLENDRREWESKLALDLENDRRSWQKQLEEKRDDTAEKIRKSERRTARLIILIMVVQALVAIGIAWWQDWRSSPLPASEPTVRESLADDPAHGIVEP